MNSVNETALKETTNDSRNKSTKNSKLDPKQSTEDPLKEYFNSIANSETLRLNFQSLISVLSSSLRIDLTNVSRPMKNVLAESLCYFIKNWSGWKEYKNLVLKDECFSKFKDYLRAKLTYIVENEGEFCKRSNKPKPTMVAAETQTDLPPKNNKPEAPFSLTISGPPHFLNNMVFVEINNNFLLKQHSEKPWKLAPSTTFFLNHPYVKISINLPKILFSRSNIHDYKSYLTDDGDMASCLKTDFISEVVKTSNVTPKVFSFNFISAYFEQLISIMAKYNVKNCLLIQSIMNEYLRDIKDCNINGCTMASPFMVTFNIGKNVYVRNKKTVACASKSKNKNVIHFCQILTPKVAFSLEEFNVAESGSTNTFMDLNSMDKLLKMGSKLYLQVLNNCVTFSCTLCNKVYQGEHCYFECMDHFRIVHKGEQEVVCFKCRNKFDVPNLASTRWYHNCQT